MSIDFYGPWSLLLQKCSFFPLFRNTHNSLLIQFTTYSHRNIGTEMYSAFCGLLSCIACQLGHHLSCEFYLLEHSPMCCWKITPFAAFEVAGSYSVSPNTP